jgi:plasmid stabilization system protein ParE
MTVRVEFAEDAIEQADDLDWWWSRNRPEASRQVPSELARIAELLSEQPELGKVYEKRGVKNVRWVPMHKMPYKVYYRYEPGDDVVSIVAVWSGALPKGPPLPKVK